MKILNYILERAKEPSSWRGCLLLLTALGISIEPALQESILAFGLSATGLINLLRKERK